MKRFIAALLLWLLLPVAARADEDLGPLALRLSGTATSEGMLRRANAERATGLILVTIAAMSLAASIMAWSGTSSCTNPNDDCVGYLPLILGTTINTVVAGGVGTSLLITSQVRREDALRLSFAPTANAHGGGLGLALHF